jgi:hypothetical protein
MIEFTDKDIYEEAIQSLIFFEEDFNDLENVNALVAGFVMLSAIPPNLVRRDDDTEIRTRRAQEAVAKLPSKWTENVDPHQLVEPVSEWHVVGWSRETIADAWAMAGIVFRYNPYGKIQVILATEALIAACERACPSVKQGFEPDYNAELSKVTDEGIQIIVHNEGLDFICGLAAESLLLP